MLGGLAPVNWGFCEIEDEEACPVDSVGSNMNEFKL